jgi:hypothetical protein
MARTGCSTSTSANSISDLGSRTHWRVAPDEVHERGGHPTRRRSPRPPRAFGPVPSARRAGGSRPSCSPTCASPRPRPTPHSSASRAAGLLPNRSRRGPKESEPGAVGPRLQRPRRHGACGGNRSRSPAASNVARQKNRRPIFKRPPNYFRTGPFVSERPFIAKLPRRAALRNVPEMERFVATSLVPLQGLRYVTLSAIRVSWHFDPFRIGWSWVAYSGVSPCQ